MPANSTRPLSTLRVLDWGRTRYDDALTRQQALVSEHLAGAVGDTLVFTEHDPVYTVGLRSGAESHLVWDTARLKREGIAVHKTNRGGDITYHGPGQIVGYPVVSLAPRKDLHAYLRFLEEVLIAAVARFGVAAQRRDGKTGIWVGTRKIAAIGVAVRRWIAYHGFALNVNGSLAPYAGIIPCGIAPVDGTVTSLAAELGHEVDLEAAKAALAAEFAGQWPGFLAEDRLPPAG